MYKEWRGRGCWGLTKLRTEKGRVEQPCCCTGSREGGIGAGRDGGRAEEELCELQQTCYGALGNVGPP